MPPGKPPGRQSFALASNEGRLTREYGEHCGSHLNNTRFRPRRRNVIRRTAIRRPRVKGNCMTTEVSNSVLQAPGTIAPSGRKARRPWLPLVFVAVYWAVTVLSKRLDLPIFAGFLSSMALAGLLILSFSVWWLIRGGGRLRDRFLVFLAIIAVAIVGKQIADASVGGMGLILFGVPASLSAAAVWLLFTGNRSATWRNGGMIAAFAIFCGSMASCESTASTETSRRTSPGVGAPGRKTSIWQAARRKRGRQPHLRP